MYATAKTGTVGLKALRAMPGKRKSARSGARLGARAAKRNAYLQALIHNEQVHDRLRQGFHSVRALSDRASRRRGRSSSFLEDRRAWRELRRAVVSFRQAAATVRGAKARRRRRLGAGAVVPVVVLGGAAAVAFNKGLREKLLGRAKGSENEQGPASHGTREAASGETGQSATVEPSAPADNAPPTTTEE